MDAFPLAPPPFSGRSRTVPAGNAFDWLAQGWATFTAAPGPWLAIAILFLVISIATGVVPLIGQLALVLLQPLLVAGMLHACRTLSEAGRIDVADLFVAFRTGATPLLTLGLVAAAGFLGILLIVFLVFGSSMVGGMMIGAAGHPGMAMGLGFGAMLFTLLLALLLGIPLLMALSHAPALVHFHAMPPLAAVRASFAACLANWLPFSLFGLFMAIFAFFAALPLGLGFLILIPVLAGAMYAAYRDLFIT